MPGLADLIVKGPWVAEEIQPWRLSYESGSPLGISSVGRVGFSGAPEPVALVVTLSEIFDDPNAIERAKVKLKMLAAIPAMAAAMRHSITAMRKMREDADTPEGMEIAEIAIQKMEDALRSAGLSVPLT